MSNPLLEDFDLAPFSAIRPEHIEPAINLILQESRQAIARLLKHEAKAPSWAGLMLELDRISERLQRAWSPVQHLNAVCSSPELRAAVDACLPALSAHSTELGQNRELYDALVALSVSGQAAAFNDAQKSVLADSLRSFRLSGIELPVAQQHRLKAIQSRLCELETRFANQTLDATQGWHHHVIEEDSLSGIPLAAKAQLAARAKEKALQGWLVTLDAPCVEAILTYANNAQLRELVYIANTTRASCQGPQAGRHDNTPVIDEILSLRSELAALLSYDNYAQLSLATKMAESTEQVFTFLEDLGRRSRPRAQRDLNELTAYAASQGHERLQPWDMAYYSEKMRNEVLELSQEQIRDYFPIDQVLSGLFEIAHRLFEVTLQEVEEFDSCHPDVRLFKVARHGKPIGCFYLDLYARPSKRQGAWMDNTRSRHRDAQGRLHLPVAQLVCNFMPAAPGLPARLTHDEVITLFHEFGHGLHHLLTTVEELGVSGINGVAWDAVELPSQFMENWCWEQQGLQLISGHYHTAEPLPAEILQRLLASKNFQSGLAMVRQLELALFDFELHARHSDGRSSQQVLEDVRSRVAVTTPPAYNRFANTFTHIFAGSYAAGYYSYKWAEVLSADAYSRFEEVGGIDSQVGRIFYETILASGGSKPAMALFMAFRGRAPSIDPLLRHHAIVDEAA